MKETPVPADPQYPGAAVLTGFFLFCAATTFVILGLTGYTYQLDDIKIVGLHVGGAACLALWAILWALGQVEAPPKPVWISYGAYVAICVVSTMAAEPNARWIGWYYFPYNFCTFGYVLLGSAVVSNRRMVEWSLKFWLLLTLVTTLFGMAHYVGALERLYNFLYGSGDQSTENRFRDVLLTFVNNRSMLSTILNVQFFGNFLLMVLPVTAACTMVSYKNLRRRLQEGASIAVPIFFLTSAAIGLVFAVVCIFLTYSKSSILILPLMVVGFLLGIYLFAGVRRIPYFWTMLLFSVILGATILSFVQGDLRAQFKDIDDNIGPRKLIFGGAIDMWKDHPILGAGPGSFRIYFPQYRSPDYHLNRISNVTVYAHNWFLDTLCETGLLGAGAYLAFLGSIFWLAVVALRRSTDLIHRVAIIGCATGVLCLLAGASVTPMTRWPVGSVSLNAMLGTFLGIVALTLRESSPGSVRGRSNQGTPDGVIYMRLSLAAGALCFLVYSWNWSTRFFQASIFHNEGIRRSEFLPAPPGELKGDFKLLYEESITYFRKALELNPNQPTTYYKLGNSYNRLGRTEEALQAFEMLKDYSPDYSEVHYNMAVIHFNLALRDKAELDKAKKAKDKEKIAELSKSTRLHYDQCIAEFKKANEQSNKINVGFFRANTMMMAAETGLYEGEELTGMYRMAGDIFSRVSALEVSTVIQEDNQVETEKDLRFRAFGLAVEAYNRAGDSLAAARAAERYLGEMPTSLTYLGQAADNYVKAGQPEEGLRVIDTALAANPLSPQAQQMKFDLLAAGTDQQKTAEHGRFLLLLHKQLEAQGEKFLPDDLAQHLRDQLKAAAASAKEKKS